MAHTWINHQHFIDTNDVGTVILGGGVGSRLEPLTTLRAKPAVPLLGRYRLVDIALSNCIHSGLNHIFLLTQFNSASLHRHVRDSYRFDVFSKGFVEILAAEQTVKSKDWFQGTADAVRRNLLHLRNLRTTHYIILAGDHLYSMDYRTMLATHLRSNADITVGALPVNKEAATGFGVMKVNPDGRIRQFIEKPAQARQFADLETPPKVFADYGLAAEGKPYLASMGIYVFRTEILEEILETQPDWIDFGKNVIPGSLTQRRVYCHPFTGFWEDIGTVRSYYDVHMAMVGPNPPLDLRDPRHIIYTHPRDLPGSVVLDADIRNAMICEGCHISKAAISNSVLGIRSIVHAGAKIDRSIILGADFYEEADSGTHRIPIGIGSNATISRAIIDKNARIGRNVVIRGSKRMKDATGDGYAVRDGIVIVVKNAIIPDDTKIG
jgi:glucose-1-phosphate adenylyltransferase